jgi:hypothetical protein
MILYHDRNRGTINGTGKNENQETFNVSGLFNEVQMKFTLTYPGRSEKTIFTGNASGETITGNFIPVEQLGQGTRGGTFSLTITNRFQPIG